MASTVEGAGVVLAYEESGTGPAVLMVHAIAADRHALPDVAGARVIRYDRRGYGDYGAPEPYGGTTVHEQGEDAAALLRALHVNRVVVCGDGFGALVALDLLKRYEPLVRAAVLADPPLFAFVPQANAELALQREQLQDAVARGGPAAAVELWLGADADAAALARAKAAQRAFFADYAGLASWPVTRRDLRAISAPVTVLTGPRTPWHVVEAADAIATLAPRAQHRRDGELAAAVSAQLAAADRR